MGRGLKSLLIMLGCLGFAARPVFATVTTYTSSTMFNTAIAGYAATTVNFDTSAVGPISQGTKIGNITFTSALGNGDGLAIQDLFDTTSPKNYLGSTDGGTGGAFYIGDSITMAFSPVNALGMFIITDPNPSKNDFSLNIGLATAMNSATVEQTFLDGGTVIFLGVTSTTAFSSATLTLGSSGDELWNVDDIKTASAPLTGTPEPGTFLLMGTGFLLFFKRLRKV